MMMILLMFGVCMLSIYCIDLFLLCLEGYTCDSTIARWLCTNTAVALIFVEYRASLDGY